VRVSIDEAKLYELRDSIRALGQLQAIIVVPVQAQSPDLEKNSSGNTVPTASQEQPRYEIVAGHRRYLASRLVPLAELRCDVYEDGWKAKEAAMLAENAFREDITAAEEGWKYCALVEKYTLTEAQLCAMVQQSPEYIYARMDMVRKDAVVAKLCAERKINFTVAQQLLKCPDEAHRHYLAAMAAESGATGNVVRSWVAQWRAQQTAPQEVLPGAPAPDAGSPPVENTMVCRCCQRGNDPQNLRLIYVHWFELDFFDRVMKEAGFAAPAPTAPGGGV
jgi:ParB/RepB/Spo0J family partition protein